MKSKIRLIARILLGFIFAFFGLNKFLQFLPQPELGEAGGALLGALLNSGYLMTVVAIVEVITGIMLLAGRFVPLALVLLAPIVLNIFLFHIFLEPAGIPMAVIVLALNVYLFIAYKEKFDPMLKAS